jgi:hypothetical protein
VYGVASFPILQPSAGAAPPKITNIAKGKDLETTVGPINNYVDASKSSQDAKDRVRFANEYSAPGAMFETEPTTGAEWTINKVNESQFGIRYFD